MNDSEQFVDGLLQELDGLRANQEILEESINDMATRYQDLSWDLLDSYDDGAGISLDKLKELSRTLSDMAATNPLMKRAAQLRHGYVFGKGMIVRNADQPRVRNVVEDPWNERLMFSMQGQAELALAKFTDGNLFVIYDKTKKVFTRVPLEEIDAVSTDPDSAERIWFFKRRWSHKGKYKTEWIPASTFRGAIPRRIDEDTSTDPAPVSKTKIMFHETGEGKQVGWTFGVPESLAAMSWAIAYSHYLNNNAQLVKAYAKFAYKVTQNTRRGGEQAAVKIATPGIGGTAIQPNGMELTPVNAAGSQVNFNNGQPLAAMVATSLGVSVISLLSSPGAAGGSYGAAATLDQPTIVGMTALQNTWGTFYRNVYRILGARDVEIDFPSIESDPAYRTVASLVNAYVSGAIHQREFRAAVLDVLNLRETQRGLPKVDEFNGGVPIESKGGSGWSDPVSRQGNQGAVKGGTSQGDTDNSGRTDVISKQ